MRGDKYKSSRGEKGSHGLINNKAKISMCSKIVLLKF
jgi:hypothetical protein